jgi:ubiquitin carboxyl-terminal hydrolase 7
MEHGDIIVVQRALSAAEAEATRFPAASEFMTFVRNRLVVTFRELDAAKASGGGGGALPPLSDGEGGTPPLLTLELARTSSYDDVTAALAAKLCVSDPLLLRLTGHNTYMHAPRSSPFRYREKATLLELLSNAYGGGAVADTLHYEVLDMPLPQLEALKTLRVDWYDDRVEFVKTFTLRLPKGARVRDALSALREQLLAEALLPPPPPAADAGVDAGAGAPQLRLLEVYAHKIFKVLLDDDCVDSINDSYWRMRAEAVPADQAEECMAPGERLLNCVHVCENSYAYTTAASGGSNVSAFGDPFLLKVREDETLRSVKARVAAKLGIAAADAPPGAGASDAAPAPAAADGDAPAQPPSGPPAPPGSAAEFAGWKWGSLTLSRNEHFGSDDDVVCARFRRASRDVLCGALDTYLGMEHAERRPKRTHAASYARSGFDAKPVKIYG